MPIRPAALYHAPDDSLTIDPAFTLHWQMTNCERYALQDLLRRIRPSVSLEIGTYKGGSLQVISHFSRSVYSIDIDPTVPERLAGLFPNVQYRIGPSSEVLPTVLAECESAGVNIDMVLIDGDHSTAGVRKDIDTFLKFVPKSRCIVIMHDSFNPECREGIRTASWSASPYVHMVDLDFIPGIYHEHAYDTAPARSMWGGFACAVLEPVERKGPLEVRESQRGLFEAVRAASTQGPQNAHNGQGHSSNSLVQRIRRKLS
ncbi:MAG TPA: class I SAM-dependent methyltransferase [Flavobacteriales bacterium]|nr:class I SAM-dependent methyltransferase [Flavobacteriales bacterium]